MAFTSAHSAESGAEGFVGADTMLIVENVPVVLKCPSPSALCVLQLDESVLWDLIRDELVLAAMDQDNLSYEPPASRSAVALRWELSRISEVRVVRAKKLFKLRDDVYVTVSEDHADEEFESTLVLGVAAPSFNVGAEPGVSAMLQFAQHLAKRIERVSGVPARWSTEREGAEERLIARFHA